MLKSKIYSNYFPVKSNVTKFNEEEKQTLCKWVSAFRTEVLERETNKSRRGYCRFLTYDMDRFDEDSLKSMINDNCFTEKGLAMLNSVIYRHKYNSVLSLFCFPMLTRSKIEKLFGNTASK